MCRIFLSRTSLNLKENGFLSVTIMVCPQQNEPHSLPKGNPDNIHEADSTEKHRHEKRIPVGLFTDFSTDESEPLYYLTVICNFTSNYKEPIRHSENKYVT